MGSAISALLAQKRQEAASSGGGKWGSGGPVGIFFDALSTPLYGVAGAVDAVRGGRDPISGIGEGIRNRTTFSNVLENAGAHGPAAAIGGIALDIAADPLMWATGGFSGIAKAGKLAGMTAKSLAEVGPRSTLELMRGALDLTENSVGRFAMESEEVQRRTYRRLHASDAWHSVLGPVGPNHSDPIHRAAASTAAREAAFAAGARWKALDALPADQRAIKRLELLGTFLMDRGTKISDIGGGSLKGALSGIRNEWARTAAEVFSDTKTYGPNGALLADLMKVKAMREQKINGHFAALLHQWAPEIRKLDKSKQAQLSKLIAGVANRNEVFPDVAAVFDRLGIEGHLDTIGKDIHALGIEAINPWFSSALASMQGPEREGMLEVLRKVESLNGLTDDVHQAKLLELQNQIPELLTTPAQKRLFGKINEQVIVRGSLGSTIRTTPEGVILTNLHEGYGRAPFVFSHQGQRLMRDALSGKATGQTFLEKFASANDLTIPHAKAVLSGLVDSQELSHLDYRRMLPRYMDSLFDEADRYLELNPIKLLERAFAGAAHTTSHAATFGGNDSIAAGLLEGIAKHSPEAGEKARRVFRASNGLTVGDRDISKAIQIMNNITSGVMLGPRVAVLQFMQASNPILAFGFTNTAAAARAVMTSPELAERAIRVGARGISATSLREGMLGEASFVQAISTLSGIKAADEHMRTISSVAAGLHAQDMAADLFRLGQRQMHTANGQRLLREFRQLGIDAGALWGDDAFKMTGKLSDSLLDDAMREGANFTQFTGRSYELPAGMSTLHGRFFMRFKNFTMQQANFLNKAIFDPWRHGEKGLALARATKYAMAYGWIYSKAEPLLERMKGSPTPEEHDIQTLRRILLTGAMGVWGDSAMTLLSGNAQLAAGIITGPNVSLLTKLGSAPIKAGQQAIEQQDVTQLNPFSGPLRALSPALLRQPLTGLTKDD